MAISGEPLLRRAAELVERKPALDQLPLSELKKLAGEVVTEAGDEFGKVLDEELGWTSIIGPWAVATYYYSKSRYKVPIEKAKYAKYWLDTGDKAKTDALKRGAYKQAYSDAAHSLQLFGEEALKGSAPAAVYEAGKQYVQKELDEAASGIVVTALVIGAAAILLLRRKLD
ncbi:hypothetical protein [Haliangium sp. UPWRP_2]|uniref:hypothetical protein n=1 Tax=Haliangium sp. UPWRP_2 TaxID=1931276 RepID=UPI000D0D0A33|nr:hypothetical protein [Haliangium sp. UPWRP_2]PSM30562.1 hypothetical protein BVG81_009890 [Haliangium sp. UPWRP_2]